MNHTITRALLASTVFAVGCSGSAAVSSGDAGHASDAGRPGDGAGDGHPDRAASGDSGTSTLSVDALSVAAGSAHEHEPFIGVSPGGRVGVSFTSFLSAGGITVGYRISNDRGATWGPAVLVALPAGTNEQANASITAGDDGTLYMSWGAEEHTVSGRSHQGVYVAVSAAGKTSFETPVLVTDPSVPVAVYDQPRVSVTHSGVLNVSYNETSADGLTSFIQNARSTDGGKTWKRDHVAGPGSYQSFRNEARFCRPAGNGRMFMPSVDTDVAYYYGDIGLALRYSDDDGATWSAPLEVTTATDELILDASANLGCVTSGSDVWIYYGLTNEDNLQGTIGGGPAPSADFEPTMNRVRMAHSGDGGKTIDFRTDIFDTSAARRAMYPVLVGEGQGTLDLSYYAGSFDGDPKAFLARTRSTDGRTFAPTVLVHAPLTLETDRQLPRWIGDYVGGAFQGGDLFLVFTDNAAAAPHVAFLRTDSELPKGAAEPRATAAPLDAGDAGRCYSGAKFTPVKWAPPTAFGQGACSAAQVSAYLACSGAGDCTSFRGAAANTSCLACLETDEGAAAHGPFVTQATDGGLAIVEVNFGGCQSHYDGKTAPGCCGERLNNSGDCWAFECSGCSDFQSPSQGGPTYNCYYTATEIGACTGYLDTTLCAYETLEGGVALPCASPATFVPLWCGP